MDKIDARTQSPQTQYVLRKQLIRLRKKGITNKAAAEIIGICETHASAVWQTYLNGGIEAIKPKVRGRRLGAQRRLTVEQETAIQKLLVDKTPDQLKLPFALWPAMPFAWHYTSGIASIYQFEPWATISNGGASRPRNR